jgi:hypothetical protein
MRQYRIKEFNGEFIIEGSYETTYNIGSLWWKKEIKNTSWSELNMNHDLYDLHMIGDIIFLLDPFESRDEAIKYVNDKILITQPVRPFDRTTYHYMDVFKTDIGYQIAPHKPTGGTILTV